MEQYRQSETEVVSSYVESVKLHVSHSIHLNLIYRSGPSLDKGLIVMLPWQRGNICWWCLPWPPMTSNAWLNDWFWDQLRRVKTKKTNKFSFFFWLRNERKTLYLFFFFFQFQREGWGWLCCIAFPTMHYNFGAEKNTSQYIDGARYALLMAMLDKPCQMVLLFTNCCLIQIAHSINWSGSLSSEIPFSYFIGEERT